MRLLLQEKLDTDDNRQVDVGSIAMACDAAHKEKEGSIANTLEARQRREPNTAVASAPAHTILAAQEYVIRSRIDRFIAGYGLTPMGKAVALNWIQVMKRASLKPGFSGVVDLHNRYYLVRLF